MHAGGKARIKTVGNARRLARHGDDSRAVSMQASGRALPACGKAARIAWIVVPGGDSHDLPNPISRVGFPSTMLYKYPR